MTEIWELIRVLNWMILFVAWVLMIYKGILRMVTHAKAWMWDRFMNFTWTSLAVYAIGEVLWIGTEGGPRIFLQTIVAVAQLWVVLFRYDVHECFKEKM